jgi:hypothetical protein
MAEDESVGVASKVLSRAKEPHKLTKSKGYGSSDAVPSLTDSVASLNFFANAQIIRLHQGSNSAKNAGMVWQYRNKNPERLVVVRPKLEFQINFFVLRRPKGF